MAPEDGRSGSHLPIIWFSHDDGYPIRPEDIANAISAVIVAFAIYYAIKIVRLSDRFEYVALKGGRAPYYIVAGMVFLEMDRVLDLLTNWMTTAVGYQVVVTLDLIPASLAGFFIVLGLREMYAVYIRNSGTKRSPPAHNEVWETEKMQT